MTRIWWIAEKCLWVIALPYRAWLAIDNRRHGRHGD